jgi:hypothetical protein
MVVFVETVVRGQRLDLSSSQSHRIAIFANEEFFRFIILVADVTIKELQWLLIISNRNVCFGVDAEPTANLIFLRASSCLLTCKSLELWS